MSELKITRDDNNSTTDLKSIKNNKSNSNDNPKSNAPNSNDNASNLSENLKNVKISGDASYKKNKLYNLTENNDGERVEIFGWVTKCSALKNFTFVVLTSHLKSVKCVLPGSVSLTFSTSITVFGTVKKCSSKKDEFTFEIHADRFEIYNDVVAPSFPLNKFSDKEAILEHAHLAIRLPERSLFLKARSELLYLFREFYRTHQYTEITPPTIVQTQVEGGSTLFVLDYYGEPAYLTQSSQLYLETVAPVLGKAFCIMPSYRAEKSHTSRHLSEYTHVEAELCDIVYSELMDSIEGLIRYVTKNFYELMMGHIRKVHPDFQPLVLADEPFKRISYRDAIQFLIEKRHMKPDGTPYQMMDDIADASERFLVEEYGNNQPVFLMQFPTEHKPFYMRNGDGVTESCDLLFPGIGEVAGGSMRMDETKKLEEGFKREGISPEPYGWYIDMSRFGPSMHGGYGIGLERILMRLLSLKNVDEATLYPRKTGRCFP